MSLDLNKLEKKLDDALAKETPESATAWLNEKRKDKPCNASVDFFMSTYMKAKEMGASIKSLLMMVYDFHESCMENDNDRSNHLQGLLYQFSQGDFHPSETKTILVITKQFKDNPSIKYLRNKLLEIHNKSLNNQNKKPCQ